MRRTCDDWIGPRGRSHARPAGVEWRGTDDGARFETLFTLVPCVILGAAAACGAIGGSQWSRSAAPIPWVVAIFLVGLPHGAADYAVSRRTWQGRDLLLPWLAYGLSLIAVVIGFACAPLWVLGGFVVLSCWHFGSAHADGDGMPRPLWSDRVVSSWARGGLVLAGPLMVWPAETAALVDDLLRLTHAAPGRSLSPAAVAAVGLGLGITASAAWGAERWRAAWQARDTRPRVPLSAELLAIGGLGCLTDPLFAVGLYFLAWHGWRQMEGLTSTIGCGPPRSWREVAMGIVRLHREALPLLVPAWGLLGAAWWAWSPRHTGRDLALLSIAGYVVVTPAHVLLGMLVRRATFRHLRSGGGTVRT